MNETIAGDSSAAEHKAERATASVPSREASLLGAFSSIKFLAGVAGVLAGIWALFPSYYTQGYLETLNVPTTYFPVEAADTPATLHRVMMSLLANFLIPLTDHPGVWVIAAISALALTAFLWQKLRKPKGSPSSSAKPKWTPSATVLSVGAGIYLALVVYLLPRVLLMVAAILLLLPYVAQIAGQKDAQAVLAKRSACNVAAEKRPLGCVVVRYETKGLDGKEKVVDLAGVIVAGNSRWLAMLAGDDVITVPANVVGTSARLVAPVSR
ncbi:hypothetical protein C1O66_13745 [Paucibacter aquatile]|uniref:Uncharacterized protein n=1 Tax=Kinneretia aquatilis TaxID=2070761 RepID=A0A2N8KYE7_9BURK|nr:hypothetical protein [Paucibacter aquatile]PND38478.1 hypothetical protein C1O66_13745 [Paucibacter aquatile]